MEEKCPTCRGRRFIYHGNIRIDDFSYDREPCPECNVPGFAVTDIKEGLECSLCYMPTRAIKSLIYCCQHCNFTKEVLHPNNKTSEDPMYCDFCNP